MITLNKYFVDQLSQYLSFLNTETSHDDLSELISNLQEILKRRTINNDEIENYRKKIKSLIAVTINTLTPNGIHISTILYFLLIKLAELSPFNEECVKTYMPIPNQKKIFLTNGYQYDIDVISEHIERRKEFIDIYTNQPFNELDIALILLFANNNHQLLDFLPLNTDVKRLEILQFEIYKLQAIARAQDTETQQLNNWIESKHSADTNKISFATSPSNPLLRRTLQTTSEQQQPVVLVSITITENAQDEDNICSRLTAGCYIS